MPDFGGLWNQYNINDINDMEFEYDSILSNIKCHPNKIKNNKSRIISSDVNDYGYEDSASIPDKFISKALRGIKDITGCGEDVETRNIRSAEPGHMVYFNSPYEDLVLMVESVSEEKLYLVRYDGKGYSFYTNQRYEDVIVVPFVPTATHIEWFASNISFFVNRPYDSENLLCVADIIRHKYEDAYKKLNLKSCSICGNVAIPKITVGGVVLCERCYERNYVHCAHCGESVKRSSAFRDKSDNYLCPECNKRHWVLPYHTHYPLVEFYGDSKGNDVPFMGFELEVDCGGENHQNVAELMPLINKEDTGKVFAYCSRDGSLNDGFEIITQPATMQYHLSIRDVYNRAIQKLKAMGYASHETTTCGLHVHFNRSFFDSDDCVCRLLRMTEKFWNELCVFARRPERMTSRYAKRMPDGMSIEDYVEVANRCREHSYHYYAVNIANRDTIEIRIFRGTLNLNTLMATLQLVNNMAVFAKTKTMEEVENMKFEDLLTTHIQRKYWNRRKEVLDFEE